jgi:tetratricopeptide (TPR) repeat protein
MRQSLVALAPGAGEAHFNLGDVLWKQGRTKEAIDSFREAVRLMPDSPEARNNLGAVLQETGRLDEAIAEYRSALALSSESDRAAGQSTGSPILPSAWLARTGGDSFAAHSNLADALAKTNRQEEAVEHYRIALEHDPRAVKVRTNLGATLSALERYDEAVRELNEVLVTDPGYSAAHINLASILEFQGKTAEAVRHYEAVLGGSDERAAEFARNALGRLRPSP